MTKEQFAAFDSMFVALIKESRIPSLKEFREAVGSTVINLENKFEGFAFYMVQNHVLKSNSIRFFTWLEINISPELMSEVINLLTIKIPGDQAIKTVNDIIQNKP